MKGGENGIFGFIFKMKNEKNFISFELFSEEKIKRIKKNLDNHLSIVTQIKNGASIQEDE